MSDEEREEVSREARTPAKRRHSDLFTRWPALERSTPREQTVQWRVERDRNVARRPRRDAYKSRRERIEESFCAEDGRGSGRSLSGSDSSLYDSVSSLFQDKTQVTMAPKLIGVEKLPELNVKAQDMVRELRWCSTSTRTPST
jgi:hypothetical protein